MARHDRNRQPGVETTAGDSRKDIQTVSERPVDLQTAIDAILRLPESERIARLWEDQRRRWRCGAPVLVEEYLRHLDPLGNATSASDALVCDLVYGEFVLRTQLGESPETNEYRARFPEFANQLQRQLRLEEAIDTAELPETVAQRTAAQSRSAASIPASIGKYQIVALLDRGGQADIYRAIHPGLQKEVVIKWGRSAFGECESDQQRLMSEGRLLAELDHPNLARVLDCDVAENRPYLVMEYVRGRNLEQFTNHRPLAYADAARLIASIARAADAAHRRGVVHLDIKPKNIVVDESGAPRLIDFGLARILDAWRVGENKNQGVAGSLRYMAPEQGQGDPSRIGSACDVYALGAVLHYLLTGRPPRTGTKLHELLLVIGSGDWEDAALEDSRAPRSIKSIVRRAMAVKPEHRFASAAALADALQRTQPRAFRRGTIAQWSIAGGLVLACWLVLQARFGETSPAGSQTEALKLSSQTAAKQSAAEVVHPSPVLVKVWHETRYIDLADALPLRAGDRLQVEAAVPNNLFAMMVIYDSDSKLSQLSTINANDSRRLLRYPERTDQAVGLTGTGGTDVVLVCGRTSKPIDFDELRVTIARTEPLPKLPEQSLLRISNDQVEVEQRDRGFGPPIELADPEGDCQRELAAMLERLRKRYTYMKGIAFSHHE